LVPFDVFEPFNTAFILQFIKLQSQFEALQQAYNDLAMAVSVVEDKTSALPAGPTNTTQTNTTNFLCGPPRVLRRNSFVFGYQVQIPSTSATSTTPCNNVSLEAFKAAVIAQVNSKDPCPDNKNVNVTVQCDQSGPKAFYEAAVEIYSHYPCR
jgi:hypothetical protein